ncbi:MAG TPA: hypothetical protein VJ732_09335, partial [Bryobacteraceae bacterium]|nr:hypothetical protein [Bryobacteraceae bacterium]
RVPEGRRAAAAIYSLTSALILAPLLWEAAMRFHSLSNSSAAAILAGFTFFGLGISWHRRLLLVATIAILTGILSAIALLIGTEDLLPFTFLLLAIADAVELSACLDHWLSERWVAAGAADLAILLATYLVTSERGLPPSYAPVPRFWLLAAQAALLAIYLSSTLVRTLARGFSFGIFEAAQLPVALLLAVGGGLRLSATDPALETALAAGCLVCGAAFYGLSFRDGQPRGRRTYAVLAFLLVLAGSGTLLGWAGAAAGWPALALFLVGARIGALRWHASLYLLLGIVASGALSIATSLLLGGETHGSVGPVLWQGAAAFLCYVLAAGGGNLFRLTLAAPAFWLMGALAAAGLTTAYHGGFGELAPHAYCATLRTAVLAAGALLLAWAGSRWRRTELIPLVYAVMFLGGGRLLLIDFHQDRAAALVLSLLCYGTALILLARLMQPARGSPS